MADEPVKTHFKGPGEWRSQAKKLEQDEPVEETPPTENTAK